MIINGKQYSEGFFKFGRCDVIVSIRSGKWHLSISTPLASPSHDEIKEARYKFIPDHIIMAQIFPPKGASINLDSFCNNLFEIGRKDIKK